MKGTQYSQKLSPKKAAEGMAAATENAVSLLADAHLLFDNERYERSVALAILAIEESGKVSILRLILVQDDPKELNRAWKDYRSHTSKNVQWQLPAFVAEGARQLEEFRGLFDRNSSHGAQLDSLKQAAFYTDAVGACEWITPGQIITKEVAEAIMQIAKVLVRADSAMCTEPALELWLKHLKPVQGRDMLTMKQALINCYQEAERLRNSSQGQDEGYDWLCPLTVNLWRHAERGMFAGDGSVVEELHDRPRCVAFHTPGPCGTEEDCIPGFLQEQGHPFGARVLEAAG